MRDSEQSLAIIILPNAAKKFLFSAEVNGWADFHVRQDGKTMPDDWHEFRKGLGMGGALVSRSGLPGLRASTRSYSRFPSRAIVRGTHTTLIKNRVS